MSRLRRRDLLLGLASTASMAAIGARAKPIAPAPSNSIAVWGDSLSLGYGAQTVAGQYPNVLGRLFSPARTVYNGGVGGDTSPQIAARMLADEAHRAWIGVLWAGRNNVLSTDRVLADIAAMVAHLDDRRFLVLSILNADLPVEYDGSPFHAAVLNLNAMLQHRYAEHYVDVRQALVRSGLTDLGLTPTPRDQLDMARDVPPTTLRADHIHLNDIGQAIVARQVHDAILRRGW